RASTAPISAHWWRGARRSASSPKAISRPARSKHCSHQPADPASSALRPSISATLNSVDAEHPDQTQYEAPLRVVLADDAVLLREGIASLLERKGFEIVGQSGTAEDLLLKVRSYH